MLSDPHAMQILTDGSCYKNPGGLSGCAAIVIYPDDSKPEEQIVDFGAAESNISRMELMACNRAMEWLCKLGRTALGVTRVQIVTDSRYVHDNINRAVSWRKNGWRNFDGRPIDNSDLWKRFISLRSRMSLTVTFHWTKGKKTPQLKLVDKAAKKAAKSGEQGVDFGFRGGKVGRAKGDIKGSASLFPARGQTEVICPYRSVVIGKSENKIRFVLFSEERKKFLEKCFAYAPPEIGYALHRGHSYRVRFGNNPKYPVIEELIEEVTILATHIAHLPNP
jgi:ribonuclease HI